MYIPCLFKFQFPSIISWYYKKLCYDLCYSNRLRKDNDIYDKLVQLQIDLTNIIKYITCL